MSFTISAGLTPQFVNYKNVYKYKNLPLKKIDGSDSDVVVDQKFNSATPAVFSDTANWSPPITHEISGALKDHTLVNFDNIFNADGSGNIVGVISGNVTWNTTLPSNLGLVINLTATISGSSVTSQISIPNNTPNYYFYINDADGIIENFTSVAAAATKISAIITGAASTNYFTTESSSNWKYEAIEIGTAVVETPIDIPYRHIGILHAKDFAVNSNTRRIVFDGTGSTVQAFKHVKTTSAELGTSKTLHAYSIDAGWPTYSSTVGNNTYAISAWSVKDGSLAAVDKTIAQNFTIVDRVGDIVCTPKYSTTPTIKTIYPNVTWHWSAANTTNKDQFGTFGGQTWDTPSTSKVAKFVVDAFVDSRNEKLTHTGANTYWIVSGYKGSYSISNAEFTVPIINNKVTITGIWYLEYGSWNYLHPKEDNWHNGSGWLKIKSITY